MDEDEDKEGGRYSEGENRARKVHKSVYQFSITLLNIIIFLNFRKNPVL